MGQLCSTAESLFSTLRSFLFGAVSCLSTFIELSSQSFLRNRPTLCIPSLPPSIALREEFPLESAVTHRAFFSILFFTFIVPFNTPSTPSLQYHSSSITIFTPHSPHPSLHLFTAHCLNRPSVPPFSRLVNVATFTSITLSTRRNHSIPSSSLPTRARHSQTHYSRHSCLPRLSFNSSHPSLPLHYSMV